MLFSAPALFAFFQSPAMLFGTLAVGVPIIIHLFFRSRFRIVPWGAMKFLLTSIEQTSRRLKFQEMLLLATRCALLGLLALALARPTTLSDTGSSGEPVDAVLVIDTSYSMAAREGTQTRMDHARREALKIIDQLPPQSTVQIVACSDRATVLGPREPGDIDTAKEILRSLTATSQASDLEPGIREAALVLDRGQSANKKLFIFSDMHKAAWEKQPAAIADTLKDARDRAGIFLVHCKQQKTANAAVVGITPQAPMPRPGERCGFSVLVKNTSNETLADLRVGLFVDGREDVIKQFLTGEKWAAEEAPRNLETAAIETLAPGETRLVTLTGLIDRPGLRVLTACLLTDDLAADNRLDAVLDVREQVQVLVVDGGIDAREAEKSASFYLLHAMMPVKEGELGGHHLMPKVVPPRLASPADLDRSAICILVNCPLPGAAARNENDVPDSFIDALAKFVRSGRGLIVFGGDNVRPDDYNRLLFTRHGLLPYRLRGLTERTARNPLVLSRHSANLPAYLKFRDDELYRLLDAVVVFKAFDLDEPLENRARRDKDRLPDEKPPAKDGVKEVKDAGKEKDPALVALRYEDGAPAVAVRRVGAGEVVFITTSADQGVNPKTREATWNLFSRYPLGRVYVPFIQTTLAHLLQQQAQNYNVVAGESLVFSPRDKEIAAYKLMRPDKSETRLGEPERKEHRLELALRDFDHAGVYRLKAIVTPKKGEKARKDDDPGTPLAVIPDLRESEDLATLSQAQLDGLLGFTPSHWLIDGTQAAEQGLQTYDTRWAFWLLLAVLVLVLFEVGLAHWCSRGW